MAKVFDGKSFLAQRETTVTFSNGVTGTVSELNDGAMKALDALGKDEDTSVVKIREVVAKIVGCPSEKLDDVGVVELRGAMDFLSENLFG